MDLNPSLQRLQLSLNTQDTIIGQKYDDITLRCDASIMFTGRMILPEAVCRIEAIGESYRKREMSSTKY